MQRIEELLASNRRWAEEMKAADPQFFERMGEEQAPDFLWIGCSDSRISPIASVGMLPGEMFVHRNVANLVNHSDMNCLSVLQFAIEVLKVEHVIICGHYECGGVKAAFENARYGLVDNWLRGIQDTRSKYAGDLDALSGDKIRLDKLCELNVIEQVISVGETTIAQDAWGRGHPLHIHGWIYRITEGTYRDMNISVSSLDRLTEMRAATFGRLAEILPSAGVAV